MVKPGKEPVMPVDHQQARSIFLAAVKKATPAERAAFLAVACVGNAALRKRVEALLQAHDEPGSLLAKPANQGATNDAPAETVGSAGPLWHYVKDKRKLG